MKKLLILLMIAFMSFSAMAKEDSAEEAFHQWELSLVRINFVASVGIEIAWITSVTLQPQVEFIWK